MLHVHILLVAPLGSGDMAQPGADQHKGGITVREGSHHTGAAADFPIKPLNNIVGSDSGPVFVGKITVLFSQKKVGIEKEEWYNGKHEIHRFTQS